MKKLRLMNRNKRKCSMWNIFEIKTYSKKIINIIFVLVFVSTLIPVASINAAFYYPEMTAKSNLLIDADTGIINIQNNIDKQLGIASLTKLMTIYVALEEIDKQKIQLTDEMEISTRAAGIKNQNPDNSGVYFLSGTTMTINKALQLILVYSDNGVAAALAEHLSTTEEAHVRKMNQKAKELGMDQTIFYNVSGLTMRDYGDYQLSNTKKSDYNMSSARDIGILAKKLINKFPEVLKYTEQTSVVYEDYQYNTWNQMLPNQLQEYSGVKGLKTGTSLEAGQCFVGYYTFKDNNYISVVLGADPEVQDRFTETAVMYNWITEESNRMIKMTESDQTIINQKLKGAQKTNIDLYTAHDLNILKEENVRMFLEKKELNPNYFDQDGKLIKTIPANDIVITYIFDVPKDNIALQTVDGKEYQFKIELVTHEEIKQAGYIQKGIQAIELFGEQMFNNIF